MVLAGILHEAIASSWLTQQSATQFMQDAAEEWWIALRAVLSCTKGLSRCTYSISGFGGMTSHIIRMGWKCD